MPRGDLQQRLPHFDLKRGPDLVQLGAAFGFEQILNCA